jgi:beta-RFAP synthase
MEADDLAVQVTAPSRLHFGLLALGAESPRQFGGVGVMIDRPVTEVVVDLPGPTSGTAAADDVHRRAAEFADRCREDLQAGDRTELIRRLRIRVSHHAPPHVGLGSGTQLALSVARAISLWAGTSDATAAELARRVGRGRRSGIGVHGFHIGGFIVDGGKRERDAISPLVARLEFPAEWHFVLVIPTGTRGLHGDAEREAFAALQSVAPSVTADLCRLTLLGLLPTLADRDHDAFSECVFEFGRKVGECFARLQGGTYSHALADPVIEFLHRNGVRGVAQSSWGPTLCAVTDSRFRAEWIAARLTDMIGVGSADVVCTPANNVGARTRLLRAGT